MKYTEPLFWVIVPYLVLLTLAGGLVWRYRYDKFGWTTRSSQLYESRLLRVASPLFHYGLLFVIAGHVIGLFIPASWTEAIGLSDHAYHLLARIFGGAAGLCVLTGLILLIYRRRRTGPVFRATTGNDKVMYAALVVAILAGLAATLSGAEYRDSVSPWFRSIFVLRPDAEVMADAPLLFKIHVAAGMVMVALFPFTRLVHALSAPVGYLFRPYLVYRSRV
ncbi:respiratory nitrate reductase subunit gamma [Nonomuraea typhae]|uniref:respiratory nitrate reductase subunit gamma n=1 Tax=Nonomuraea typhae TaxID=2603600 RepID=UPI0012FC4A77|nr:respiratory nitrate reductase subunit gamma [Nonomuraea typhae]